MEPLPQKAGPALEISPDFINALNDIHAILTPRRRQVFRLYLQGKSVDDISRELQISRNAVCFHTSYLNKRLLEKIRDKRHQELPHLSPDAPKTSTPMPSPGSPAPALSQTTNRRAPLLERLRRRLQALAPLLYAQVLEPTLADLCQEHSAALAEGHPLKARRIFLQGCMALAAAAVSQLGFSVLGRIAALWQARSSK